MLRGTVVEESLQDNRYVNGLEVVSVRISDAEESGNRWHLYRINLPKEQLIELSGQLRPEKWYAHFWDSTTIFVVFPGKVFEMSRWDKSTWQPVIDYGQSIGIPTEQLDFLIEE